MGLTPVPGDRIATIVTTLEMRERPKPRPLPEATLRLERWPTPDLGKYRALFARVGGPWLWFSRLVMHDGELARIVHDDAVEVFAAVDRGGIEVGMLELDRRRAGECELSYFGLVPELASQGLGRWLMAETLVRAWSRETSRVWVHTCTLDHSSALNFYRAQGFTAIARTIETFDDPRVLGVLPPDAAPHVPLLASARQATTPVSSSATR